MSYSCDGTRSGATEKGPEADMFAGTQRSSGKRSHVLRRSRTMLFVRWSDSHKRSKYHTHSAVESTEHKRRKMRCRTQSTRRTPTALTQLVTPTKTEKLNDGNLAETVVEADSPGSSQQIPWNPSCPNLASFVIHGVLATHHPSLPSEPPDDGQCLCACRSQNAE